MTLRTWEPVPYHARMSERLQEEGKPYVVLITAPDMETGRLIARKLVEERLLACANVVSSR